MPSTAPTRGACSRRSSACSAISISPKRRCTTPLRRRSSSGRATACPTTLARGSSRPAASRRSTACAGVRATTRRCRSLREQLSAHAPLMRPRPSEDGVEDDRLRLIFTCCHPALTLDAQVALTLREVCGLTTEEIARAFLTNPPTVAQRIVRAKAKIRDARIPYQVPSRDELPGRLDAVLHVVYLVFNEGYSASSGSSLTRGDLSAEAIRLGRLLVELLPGAGSHRSARADAAARIAARRALDRRTASWCCSTIRIDACGIAR